LLMGIINLSPDSFSGDGVESVETAVAQAAAMLEAGADILDIGAMSSRPGAAPVGTGEEQRRLLPALEAIRATFPQAFVSVDTHRGATAKLALAAGANLINDIHGGRDAELLEAVAQAGAYAALMHNQAGAAIGASYAAPAYKNVVEEVAKDLAQKSYQAILCGIKSEKIIVDCGIGFGKSITDNVALLKAVPRLASLGFPVMVGASGKSFLGAITGLPVGQRLSPSLAAAALAALGGAHILRVHNVAETKAVLDVVRAYAAA
jgi:dihydropteroate synthase